MRQGQDVFKDRSGREGPYWTAERIVVALQRHAERLGRAPTATEWKVGRAPKDYLGGEVYLSRPCFATVCKRFGSWTAALEAAGLQARRSRGQTRCRRGHRFTPDNTIVKSGKRRCRRCKQIAERERYWRVKGAS